MQQIHGHEVLDMMQGNSYQTTEELRKAIIAKFGTETRFYTCSAQDMTADELIDFLVSRGKFMPTDDSGFTVDMSKRCNH